MKWVGFDFDGTLADKSIEPVPRIVQKLHYYLQHGILCKVVTARADKTRPDYIQKITEVYKFLFDNGFPPIEVTNSKDHEMVALYDDRAISVKSNLGHILVDDSWVMKELEDGVTRLPWSNLHRTLS